MHYALKNAVHFCSTSIKITSALRLLSPQQIGRTPQLALDYCQFLGSCRRAENRAQEGLSACGSTGERTA